MSDLFAVLSPVTAVICTSRSSVLCHHHQTIFVVYLSVSWMEKGVSTGNLCMFRVVLLKSVFFCCLFCFSSTVLFSVKVGISVLDCLFKKNQIIRSLKMIQKTGS